jgi:hypothetical protein
MQSVTLMALLTNTGARSKQSSSSVLISEQWKISEADAAELKAAVASQQGDQPGYITV